MVIEENFIKARVVLKISSLSTISFSPRLDFLGGFFCNNYQSFIDGICTLSPRTISQI